MLTDAIEKQGIDPLVSTLTRLGGWPMIMEPNQWDEQEYSWQKVDEQYMRLTGRNAFYDVRVNKDSGDPKVVEVLIVIYLLSIRFVTKNIIRLILRLN